MIDPSLSGLSKETTALLTFIFAKHLEIEKAILYGSRAKGDFKPGSDIDLTLLAPAFTLSDLMEVESEIEDLSLPYKVDLSLFHKIENDSLIDHIHRVGVEFYLKK